MTVPTEAIAAAYDAVDSRADIPAPATMKRILDAAAPHIAAAERERIRQRLLAEAQRQETANFSTIDTICGATLRDFADLIGDPA